MSEVSKSRHRLSHTRYIVKDPVVGASDYMPIEVTVQCLDCGETVKLHTYDVCRD